MLIVFLPLWQIVTFLPYWYWSALIALWPALTPPRAANATSRPAASAAAAVARRTYELVNWAPSNSCAGVCVLLV